MAVDAVHGLRDKRRMRSKLRVLPRFRCSIPWVPKFREEIGLLSWKRSLKQKYLKRYRHRATELHKISADTTEEINIRGLPPRESIVLGKFADESTITLGTGLEGAKDVLSLGPR